MPADEGYSGTPLPKKLGIREGDVVCVVGDPGNARRLIAPLPPGASFGDDLSAAEVVVLFVASGVVRGAGRAARPRRLPRPLAVGRLAEAELGRRDRHDRGRRSRGGAAPRRRRQQGLRDRRHLVGVAARLAQGAARRSRLAWCGELLRATNGRIGTKREATAEASLSRRLPLEGSTYLSTSASAAPSRSVEVAPSCSRRQRPHSPDRELTGHPNGVDEPASPAENRFNALCQGRLAQLVEHLVYTEGVGGSSPSPPMR